MQRERPTIVLVMAILNIVMGSLCSVSQLCTVGSLAFMSQLGNMPAPPGPQGTPNPLQEVSKMYDYVPGFYAITISYAALAIILQVVLIFAGVGLLYMRPWARWTSVGYSVAVILLSFAHMIYGIVYVQPGMERWQRDFLAKMSVGPAPPPPPSSPIAGVASAGVGFVMNIIYPIALLIVMFLPMVGAAFAGKRSFPIEPDDRRPAPPAGPADPHITIPRRF
jgi:hypothetical protein